MNRLDWLTGILTFAVVIAALLFPIDRSGKGEDKRED